MENSYIQDNPESQNYINNSNYLNEYIDNNILDYDSLIENSKLNNNINLDNTIVNNINTNIHDYSVDDIFKLLDLNIDEDSDYNDVKDRINEKINNYIKIFSELKNESMITFFENIRSSILGESENNVNKTLAEELLLVYNDKVDIEPDRSIKTNNTDTSDKNLYNSKGGAGNQLNRKTVTKLLTVDSRFRNNYDNTLSTDYTVDLPYHINNVIELKLSDLELPTTYYPFNDLHQNNYFWLKYEYMADEVLITRYIYFYIIPGNYFHTTIVEYIQKTFDQFSLPLTISLDLDYTNKGGIGVGTGKISINYNNESEYTLLYTITNIELIFDALPLDDSYENYRTSHVVYDERIINKYVKEVTTVVDYKQLCGWMLGFRQNRYNSATDYTAEAVLDILGPKYLFLVLDDLNNSTNVNFFNNYEKSILPTNILARISIKGHAFSIQSQTDLSLYSEPRYYFGPVNIHKLNIKLVDEYNRLIDLNSMDFSFTLSLTTIYSQTS